MNRFITKWLIGLLALSLLLGSVSVAWAQPASPRRRARPRMLRGQVTALDGANLTVEIKRGEITVLTDDETRVRIPEVQEASVADIQVGQQIAIRGQREGDTLRARLILVIPEGVVRLFGTVEAIADQALTLFTKNGEVTLQTDENTRFLIPGVEAPGLDDLETGAQVTVAGIRDDQGNIAARLVQFVPQNKPVLVRGEVTAVGGEEFTLATRQSELTVQVDEKTRFRFPGVEAPGLDDLQVGTQVVVGGFKNTDGSLSAKLVGTIPERLRRAVRVMGRIEAIEGNALTLTVRNPAARFRARNEVTVLTDENTRFVLPGVDDPSNASSVSIDDFEIGQIVGAVGQWSEEGVLQARIVGARPPRPNAPSGELPSPDAP